MIQLISSRELKEKRQSLIEEINQLKLAQENINLLKQVVSLVLAEKIFSVNLVDRGGNYFPYLRFETESFKYHVWFNTNEYEMYVTEFAINGILPNNHKSYHYNPFSVQFEKIISEYSLLNKFFHD